MSKINEKLYIVGRKENGLFFQYYRVLMIIFVLCRHLHTIFSNELLFNLLDGGNKREFNPDFRSFRI